MPAIEHDFDEPIPLELYLDTDFLISALILDEPHHARSDRFAKRLIDAPVRPRIFISVLTRVEFLDVVCRARFRERLPEDFRDRMELAYWQRRAVRRQYVAWASTTLESLLNHFIWEEVALSRGNREAAEGYVADFNLRSIDAMHLATASDLGNMPMVSFDEAFRRVDGLHLWNDRIHG